MTDVDTADNAAADEFAALHPEKAIAIAGKSVTVRPIGFIEGARYGARLAPVIDALAPLFEPDAAAAPAPLDTLAAVFAEHVELFTELLALTTGEPRDWIEGLADEPGQTLLLTFWSVNAPFFVRRLLLRSETARMARQAHEAITMAASPPSKPSFAPSGTAAAISSA